MEKEIIVHMGIPKTGSSSLQKFLACNQEALNANGWSYPDTFKHFNNLEFTDGGRWKNGGLASFEFGVLDCDTGWKKQFDRFIKILENSLAHYNVLLSCEEIWWRKSGIRYICYLKERYQRVRLIVYLRRQDISLESGYGEHVRTIVFGKHCTETIEEFRKSIMQRGWVQRHLYYEKLKEWESIVGRECMAVYTYEEAREYGLFRHFIDFLGLDYAQFQEVESANISLSAMDIEIKRRLNQLFLNNELKGELCAVGKFLDDSRLRFEGPRGSLLSPEERQEILDFFAEDNKRTAEEYFYRNDLFPDKVDYPQVILNEAEVEKKYVKTLEQMIVHMIYGKKYPIIRKALDQGKKIALFGAGFMGRRAVADCKLPAEIIIDNEKEKKGQKIGGIPVVWSGDVTEWDRYIILTTPLDPSGIENQLQGLGLVKDVDFINIHTMGIM